jgi:outer membrane lipoprotein-sorting protein
VRLGKAKHAVALTALIAGLSLQAASAQTPAPSAGAAPPKLAEEVFKNIQSLKGTPADQLIPAMQFISASLNVECSFCHVQGKMDLDDKKEKKTARDMIAMTNAINTSHFKGHREITCNSCHNGNMHPQGTPPVAQTDVAQEHGEHHEAPPQAAPQSADPVLDKYVAAMGGAEAIQKVTSRVQKGNLIAGGHETPIEVVSKAPYKRVSVSHAPNGDNITAFDGTSGWMGSPGRPPRDMSAAEADAAKLDADLQFALHLKETFQQFRVGRPEKIGDAQCVTIIAIRKDQPPVRLWFDEQTGLLVRMVRFAETPLGRNPTQIDYADYRDFEGVKTPMRWMIARPNGRFTIQITDVQQNGPVDDAKFAKP